MHPNGGDKKVEIDSQHPPRPDDTDHHIALKEERMSRFRQEAAKLDAMKAERISETAYKLVVDATVGTGKERILVVDDDESQRSLWRRAFSRDNVEVVTAQDVAEATRIIEEIDILTVAVLDYKLPNGDGVWIADTIRYKWPGTWPVSLPRIIVASGYDSVNNPNVAMRKRFLAVDPSITFEPKEVAQQAVRQTLRTPIKGIPPTK